MKTKIIIGLVILVAAFGVGYYWQQMGLSGESGEPIKIGFVSVLTGPVAAYGELQMRGAQMAADEINEGGGVNGRKIELVFEDSAYEPRKALDAYQALKLKGIKYYIADGSPIVASIHDRVLEDGNFAISQGAVAPAWKDGNKLTCRIALTAENFGPSIAGFLIEKLKFKKVSFLLSDNEYGRAMGDETEGPFKEKGGVIVSKEYFATASGDLRTQITKLKESQKDVDALLIINPANTIEPMLKQLKELGWTKPIVSDVWTIRNPQLKDLSLAEGVFVADYEYSPDDESFDSGKTKIFKEAYEVKYGKNPAYLAAAVYDSIKILAEAFKEVGIDDTNEVAEYVSAIKNYSGATGSFSFDDDCEVSRQVFFRKVQNGKIINLE